MSNVAIVQEALAPEDPGTTLKVAILPIPRPAAGEVVVEIKQRPVLLADFFMLGAGGVVNGTPGSEGFGIVHEVPDNNLTRVTIQTG